MDPLHHLPLTEIAPHALLRDRTALDEDALPPKFDKNGLDLAGFVGEARVRLTG